MIIRVDVRLSITTEMWDEIDDALWEEVLTDALEDSKQEIASIIDTDDNISITIDHVKIVRRDIE